MKNIAVFYGGKSVEHDVSVITGVMTANSLDKEKFNAVPVYVAKNGGWYTGEILKDPDAYSSLSLNKLKKLTVVSGENALYEKKRGRLKLLCNVYCAINCMHGERGEDGSLAGVLNMCDIPCASPDITSSALAMDKAFTKAAMKGAGIKVLPFMICGGGKRIEEPKFGYPVIVKPVKGGSSVGVGKAENREEFLKALSYALKFGDKAIAEPLLKGFTEINCAAYKKNGEIKVSLCERPIGRTEILTFSDKYEGGKREFPAKIDFNVAAKIRTLTERAYRIFGFRGVIRIDYFVKDKTVYLNEINSVPGSLAYYLFYDTLSGFKTMLSEMIEEGVKEFSEHSTEVKEFDSGILSFCGAKGVKQL